MSSQDLQTTAPFEKALGHSRQEMRASILKLESIMHTMEDRKVEIPVRHHFAWGVYCREMTMKRGQAVVGKIHRTEHLSILSKGKVKVWNEEGMTVLTAPTTILSQPGVKRVIVALENSVWTTIHPNPDNGTDVEKIEERLIAPCYEALEGFEVKQIEENP